MATWMWIILLIVAFAAGLAVGFYAARKYMEKYLKDNPPINEEQIKSMMLQMGQKPSKKKLTQMMNSMKRNAK
ncbi:YneF family protein [Fructilactobacillus vespulae]|uniref:YneF family protein n=1 Tax=Fructilactobacillus vespulae TaxID=1249630 RepID=UPI0039B40353